MCHNKTYLLYIFELVNKLCTICIHYFINVNLKIYCNKKICRKSRILTSARKSGPCGLYCQHNKLLRLTSSTRIAHVNMHSLNTGFEQLRSLMSDFQFWLFGSCGDLAQFRYLVMCWVCLAMLCGVGIDLLM